jgi:hypothetical protein
MELYVLLKINTVMDIHPFKTPNSNHVVSAVSTKLEIGKCA